MNTLPILSRLDLDFFELSRNPQMVTELFTRLDLTSGEEYFLLKAEQTRWAGEISSVVPSNAWMGRCSDHFSTEISKKWIQAIETQAIAKDDQMA